MDSDSSDDRDGSSLDIIMNDTPSKAAIQRRNELVERVYRDSSLCLLMADATDYAFARFIDQVSETAKANRKAADSLTSWLLHRFGPNSPEGREVFTFQNGFSGNKALILRDPEPDAIEVALAEALKGQEFQSEAGKIAWSNGFREALRSCAITPLKDAEA